MKIYYLNGFFYENQFNFNLMEFPVIDCKNGLIKFDGGIKGFEGEELTSNLNKFYTGLIDTNEPSIAVITTNESLLEQYKVDIINKIKESLEKHKEIIGNQLKILMDYKGDI